MLNLYLISQDFNNDWDTYDSVVVSAKNHHQAKQLSLNLGCSAWAEMKHLKSTLIGTSKSTKPEIILGSFNAG